MIQTITTTARAVITSNATHQPSAPPRKVPAGTPNTRTSGMPVMATAAALPWRAALP